MPTEIICHDCCRPDIIGRGNPELFMLKHELWDAVGVGDRLLCWSCTESRMGRPITYDDLLECLLNRHDNPRTMAIIAEHEGTASGAAVPDDDLMLAIRNAILAQRKAAHSLQDNGP